MVWWMGIIRGWCLVLTLLPPMVVHADWAVISQADLSATGSADAKVTLPHFVRQERSGLIKVQWSFTLPPVTASQRLPALLLPQPVQGLSVWVGDALVYSLPSSSSDSFHHWYRPVLVPLPHALLAGPTPSRVLVEQTGHLRGWYIAPVLQGELIDLQVWHDRFLFLSSTLPTTVNLLSVLVGLFVLAVGWRTRSGTYVFGGLTAVVWGVLFSLALVSELPVKAWFFWRLILYACTGNLIYVVLRFLAAIFHQRVSPIVHGTAFVILQLGWILFALAGTAVEPWLDVVWTGVAVALYGLGSGALVMIGLRQREFSKVSLLGLHAALTAVLAGHDYALQSGEVPADWLQALSQPAHAWLLQPVYLTHVSLPMFVIISLWLLVQDHLRHRHDQVLHEQALRDQRDRITRDIHDGVGARLNLMLWRTRTSPLVTAQLQDELERSIEELRFAINPQQTASQTLTEALRSLCQRCARWGQPLGVEVEFDAPPQLRDISPEHGLHLYKAAHEGLSNALRHSGCSRIHVRLDTTPNALVLLVQDNGRGIVDWNPHDIAREGIRSTAMGLRGMHHRMQALGGQCIIHSDSQGTRLELVLPRQENLQKT